MIVSCRRQNVLLPSRGSRKCFEVVAFWFSSKSWMQRHKNDSYVKLSISSDLRSRSAFKLIEIQKEFNLIKPDSYVIDLGSSPGGWSVACAGFLRFKPDDYQLQDYVHHERTSTAASVAPKTFGLLCSVDLLTMKPIPGDTHFIQGDFRSVDVQNKIDSLGRSRGHNQAGCVLSDMLQNMSGQHDVDHCRSLELSLTALEFCVHSLKPGGSFLCKFLRGRDDKELILEAEKHFGDVRLVKPKASRSESTEIYLLARKKTQG